MRKEVRQRGLRSSDNVIISLRIPTLAINERELSGVKKASSVAMEYGETVSEDEGTPNNLPFRFE